MDDGIGQVASGRNLNEEVSQDAPRWGSDVAASVMRALKLPYIAIVPGSSFRGFHDSIVNFLGNRSPCLIPCLHEEHAVSIADGYGRATGKPMGVALHANVGLMHGSMAIFNAWCDRVPMLIIGATGPVDAHRRRPWIDWVHTVRDQGALIRPYVKWDDQPASAEAMVESLLRAYQITTTLPFGPSYVCLDVTMQEEVLGAEIHMPDVARFAAPLPPEAPARSVKVVCEMLADARNPVFLFGRMSRREADWRRRVTLAEMTGAAVMTSIHNSAAFPTDHAQHLLPPCGERRTEAEKALLAEADLIISFDWLDLAGYLRSCSDESQSQRPFETPIVHCSLDALLTNGWSMDHQALPAVDMPILADPDRFTAQLTEEVERALDGVSASEWNFNRPHWTSCLPQEPLGDLDGCISLGDFAITIRNFGAAQPTTFVRLPLGWPMAACRFDDPLSYLGKDGGAAVGVGPGHAVGAALALKDSGRIVTAVLGDGDTLMGINALWTASHMDLPLLIVVANNSSYFNDVLHQQRVAIARGRPEENRWIGQRLSEPEIDIPAMARAQGFAAEGPIRRCSELTEALKRGVEIVSQGGRHLIDARIEPGYAQNLGVQDG